MADVRDFYRLLGADEASSKGELAESYSLKKHGLEEELRDPELAFDDKCRVFERMNYLRRGYRALLARKSEDVNTECKGVDEDRTAKHI